jgi:hypothetical protein
MTRCPHCHRPAVFVQSPPPPMDGTGQNCFAVWSNEPDVMADCEAARRLGTAGVYEEGERRKQEYVQETLKIV